MKKLVAGVSAGAFLSLALGISSASAGAQDFTLNNATRFDIKHVYVSTVHTNSWEEDILGRDVLADGASVKINFAPDEDHCHYDLKVTFLDNESVVWGNINLCTANSVTISYDQASGQTSAEVE